MNHEAPVDFLLGIVARHNLGPAIENPARGLEPVSYQDDGSIQGDGEAILQRMFDIQFARIIVHMQATANA